MLKVSVSICLLLITTPDNEFDICIKSGPLRYFDIVIFRKLILRLTKRLWFE